MMNCIKNDDIKQPDKKTFDDYLAFFTTNQGADILPYFYLDSSELFEDLVKNNSHYYLFNDEVSLIKNNQQLLTKHLNDISEIIEIGPGTSHPVEHKTIPILNYATNLKKYYAIDWCKDYLTEACQFIENYAPELKVLAIEADLSQREKLNLAISTSDKKAIILLGGTLGCYDQTMQKHILNQIYNLMSIDDLFIVTIDTNQDEQSLLAAYQNNDKLHFACVEYFAKINPDFAKHLNSLSVKCHWNKISSYLDIYFVAKNDFTFKFQKYLEIKIIKGQELRGIKISKPKQQEFIKLLKEAGFEVVDNLTNSNKMRMFIAKKVNTRHKG